MKNELLSLQEVTDRIQSGSVMAIAGDAALLAQLPQGRWIAGSSTCFVTETGGAVIHDRLFCTTFTEAVDATVRVLPPEDLATIAEGYQKGGFTVILIPAYSETHTKFALKGQSDTALFTQPLIGWVAWDSSITPENPHPLVFDGLTASGHEEAAVLLHVAVPEGAKSHIDIINIFRQGDDPETCFTFNEDGFSARTAIVQGQRVNLARYLTENDVDTRLPLVANYSGALVNVGILEVDPDDGLVHFFAPVRRGITYKLAAPIDDYAKAFAEQATAKGAHFACNCILNYRYGELDGKPTGTFVGPVTYGEIAYVLMTQTLVRLGVDLPG